MKMFPKRGPKMLPERFEHIFGFLRIKGKPERKFEGQICNIKLEKFKLVRLNMFFGSGVPLYSPLVNNGKKCADFELICFREWFTAKP